MYSYRRIFIILHYFSRVPFLKFIVGMLLVNQLQLKIYENAEIQTNGISQFIESTLKRIVRTIEENYGINKGTGDD